MVKLFVILLVAATLAGCADSGNAIDGSGPQPLACTTPTDPAPTLGATFNVRFGEQSAIVGEGLTLTFEELVGDGRCPAGMMCLIAGDAQVVIRVVDREHAPAALSLSTNSLPSTEGSYQGYDVRLVQVSPYPENGRPATPEADYCVQLTVTHP